jgi:hypothetical protein
MDSRDLDTPNVLQSVVVNRTNHTTLLTLAQASVGKQCWLMSVRTQQSIIARRPGT